MHPPPPDFSICLEVDMLTEVYYSMHRLRGRSYWITHQGVSGLVKYGECKPQSNPPQMNELEETN